jgi:hypothetical protein
LSLVAIDTYKFEGVQIESSGSADESVPMVLLRQLEGGGEKKIIKSSYPSKNGSI